MCPRGRTAANAFKQIDEWVELGNEGVVPAHGIVRFHCPVQPAQTPFAYAVIKLDGADVGPVHMIRNGLDQLKNGVRVKAVFFWKNREGHILYIDSFEIVD